VTLPRKFKTLLCAFTKRVLFRVNFHDMSYYFTCSAKMICHSQKNSSVPVAKNDCQHRRHNWINGKCMSSLSQVL
jgi:hypothetical protein